MALAEQIRRSFATAAFAFGSCGSLFAQGAQTAPQATTISALTPAAIAYDSAGNLYIAVRGEHIIRKVDTLGAITTFAGTGEEGFSGDGGPATGADLDLPTGVAVDGNGTVYIADSRNHRIRSVSNGVISTVAGTGVAGFSGDNGSATAAQLNLPTALSVDGNGTLYIADSFNNRIRKVAGGTITTFAGTGEQGYGGDGGSATAAQLDTPGGVSVDPTGNGRLYISDTHNERVRVVDSTGNITTLAGSGTRSFSGDGSSAVNASLATPRGIGVDGKGVVYVADSDNQRIRAITGTTISTVAGDGEQGFAGDLGAPLSAILDTPSAVASGNAGVLALADTHNQRVRALAGTLIETVAGIPPALTEGILLSGPTSGVFGTSVGRLSASFTNGSNVATGPVTLTDSGAQIASAALSNNTASFDLSTLSSGLHTLAVSFPGDTANPAIASGVYLVNIAQAAQTITFAPLTTTLAYAPGLTEQLTASSSAGLPVSFSATGPATISGSTLTITGPGTVVVTASQAGNSNFAAASSVQTIVISGAQLVASSLSPGTVSLGASNTVLTITGSGFTSTSQVEVNGSPLKTTFGSFTTLTAVLPQALTAGDLQVTVVDTASQAASAPLDLKVTVPGANATLSVPAQSTSGQQPTVNLQLQAAYPLPITGKLTLTFTPAAGQGLSDNTVQLSTGGNTLNFVIPANSTTVPTVSVDTGTLTGTITLNLTLTAAGVDVTPAAARTASIIIPAQVPQIQSNHVSFTQSGSTLTVTIVGFSNTKDMSQAVFTFTGAPGTSLSTTSLTVPNLSSIFSSWFSTPASASDGSRFTYTQPFTLSDPDAQITNVTVQLVNSVGASAVATSQ